MQGKIGHFVLGKMRVQPQCRDSSDLVGATHGIGIGFLNRVDDRLRLSIKLLVLADANEQIAQMRNETTDVDAVLIELHPV